MGLRVRAFEAGLRELGWTEGGVPSPGVPLVSLATPPSCTAKQPSWWASRRT